MNPLLLLEIRMQATYILLRLVTAFTYYNTYDFIDNSH